MMFTGSLRADFRVRAARSLKDKRHVLRSLKDRLAARFGCAVAEVDAQELRQRAVVGAAVVSGTEAQVRACLDEIARYVRLDPEMECLTVDTEIVPFGDRDGDSGGGAWDIPANLLFSDTGDEPDEGSHEPTT